MDTPSRESRVYSFQCAEPVVNAFMESYARACNLVAKRLNWDPQDLREALIKRFMYRNMLWNVTRDCIKRIEKHNLYDAIAWMDDAGFTLYMKNESNIVKTVRNYLK